MADYIPRQKGEYQDWLLNIKNNIDVEGLKFGLDAPSITSVKAKITDQIARHVATVNAESALAAARASENDGEKEANSFLRAQIAYWKRKTGFTDEIAQRLGVTASGGSEDSDYPKVSFKLKIVGGEVRIDWTKGRLDGVNIYSRLRGQAGWTKIGMDTSSPYLDARSLGTPGQAEVREYMLRGVVKDAEVTGDSDVQFVAYAG